MKKKFEISLVVAVLVMLASCTTTNQAKSVKTNAFLGDSAALLKKGGKNDALLVYRKKGTDWKSYHAIILDPITIWGVESSTLSKDQLADFQKLVDQFNAMLEAKLSKDYTMTDTPSAGTMRIQIAIMDGQKANGPLKTAMTVAPYIGTADAIWTFATGKPVFAGEVSIEYMVKDSESQDVLAAGADRRVGGNQVGTTSLNNWNDVQNILIYWSDDAVYRLCLDRGASNCTAPSSGLVENPLS